MRVEDKLIEAIEAHAKAEKELHEANLAMDAAQLASRSAGRKLDIATHDLKRVFAATGRLGKPVIRCGREYVVRRIADETGDPEDMGRVVLQTTDVEILG